MTTITATERAEMRKLLLAHGERASGLTDDQLIERAAALDNGTHHPAPVEQIAAPTAPKPAAEPVATAPTTAPDTSAQLAALQQLLATLATPAPAIDEKQIIALIDRHAATPRPVSVTINHYQKTEPKTIEGAHPAMAEVLDILDVYPLTGVSPYLVGGAGSGKTTLAIQIAAALELDFYSTGAVMDKFELLGFVDANGVYQESALYKAFTRGGLFLFDEIDSSDAGALVAFNQLLANGKYTFPNGITEHKHPAFKAIAAANTIGTGATRRYVGRAPLDGATLDRFHQIEMGYDENIERAMAHNAAASVAADYTAKTIDYWIAKVKEVRTKLETIAPDVLITPRATQRGAALLAKGWDFDRVAETVLLVHLTKDQAKRLKEV